MNGFTETFIKRTRSDAEDIISSNEVKYSLASEIVAEIRRPIGGTEYDFSDMRSFIENSIWMKNTKTNNPSIAETLSLDLLSQLVAVAYTQNYISRILMRKISDYRVSGNYPCISQIPQYRITEISDFINKSELSANWPREITNDIRFSVDETYENEDIIESLVSDIAANFISNKRASSEDYFPYSVYSAVLSKTASGEYVSQINELIDVYNTINEVSWNDKYGDYNITVEYYAGIISDWVKMSISEAVSGSKREGRLILGDVLESIKLEMFEK